MVLSKIAQSVMGGEGDEQMGVGQDWVCFFGGEKYEVLWKHRPGKNIMTKMTAT